LIVAIDLSSCEHIVGTAPRINTHIFSTSVLLRLSACRCTIKVCDCLLCCQQNAAKTDDRFKGFLFCFCLLLYAHRHRSIVGAAGHIILTPANQLMAIGLKI
jgi:hypothetical protein